MSQLHPQTLKFLSNLKKNNNKEWFEKNRVTYEAVRNDLIGVVSELINEVSNFDPLVAQADAKKSIFRINRDIRFSANKAPYKNNIGAYISKGGKNSPAGGYYIHFQPGECFIGGGIWMPEPDKLAKIRQEIDYNFSEFKKIVESKSFKKTFGELSSEDKLARPPKNYTPDNPAIEYLKLKSFTVGAKIKDEDALAKGYIKKVAAQFREMNPFIDFLNRAVE